MKPIDPSEVWREVSAQQTLRLGELALALGKITPRQLEKALARQKGDPSPRKLAEILEEQGALTPTQSAELLLELERHAGKPAHPRIDRFLLLHELGRGGMGVVWEAWDTKLNRTVALKVLRVDQELERACLLREARMAGQLSHPNIPSIHEILDHQGSPCIAMSLIRGTRLDLAARDLPLRRIVEIVRDAARAIHYAHTQQVIHRDVKPENLMLDAEGKVFVMDFGLAKAAHPGTSISTANAVVGTPAYMPPEQALGRRSDVGPRSDVYGLGATLYTLLAGRPPFDGKSAAEVMMQVVHDEPRPLRKLCPRIPREIETIAFKAMNKEPRRRYASAAKFADDLDRYLRGEPILAKPASVWSRWATRVRKHRAASVAAGVLAVVAGLAVMVGTLQRSTHRSDLERERADHQKRQSAQKKLAVLWSAITESKRDLRQLRVPARQAREGLEAAVRGVDEYVRDQPDDPAGYYVRARGRLYLGDLKGAEADLREALGKAPDFQPAWSLLGMVKLEQCHRRLFVPEKLLKRTLRELEPVLKDALEAFHKGWKAGQEQATAERWGLPWTKEDGVYERISHAVALACQDKAKAREYLLSFLNQGDRAEDYAFWVGRLSDAPEERIRRQTEALGWAEGYAEAYYDRGIAHGHREDWDGAIRDMTRAIELRDDFADAYSDRGAAKALKGDIDGALADLDRAIALKDDDSLSFANRGYARRCKGDFDGAIADCTRAIELWEGNQRAYLDRGGARWKKGDREGALADMTLGIELHAWDDEIGYRGRGLMNLKMGNLDASIADMDLALKMKETHDGYDTRGQARVAKGDVEGGIADFTRSIELNPDYPNAYDHRAVARIRTKDWQGALEDLNRAVELGPNDPIGYVNRGAFQASRGNLQAARSDFQRTLELAPADWSEREQVQGWLEQVEANLRKP